MEETIVLWQLDRDEAINGKINPVTIWVVIKAACWCPVTCYADCSCITTLPLSKPYLNFLKKIVRKMMIQDLCHSVCQWEVFAAFQYWLHRDSFIIYFSFRREEKPSAQ